MRKLFCILLSVMIATSFSNSVFAASITSQENSIEEKVNELSLKYDLQDTEISEIPENSTILEFNTVEEAEDFLNEMQNEKNEGPVFDKQNSLTRTANSAYNLSWKKTILTYYMIVGATVYTNSRNEITDVPITVNDGGGSFGSAISNIYTHPQISSNKKSVQIQATFNSDCYLLIDGFIKIYSYTNKVIMDYTVDYGYTNYSWDTY